MCAQLRLVVTDPDQNMIVNDNVEVIEYTLPVKVASAEVYDTSADYKKENVNYGQ